MRVKVRVQPAEGDEGPYPVFDPAGGRAMKRQLTRGGAAIVGVAESDLGEVAPA